jgi:hypothetical protein
VALLRLRHLPMPSRRRQRAARGGSGPGFARLRRHAQFSRKVPRIARRRHLLVAPAVADAAVAADRLVCPTQQRSHPICSAYYAI